jgi:putative ABC transport system permease protein
MWHVVLSGLKAHRGRLSRTAVAVVLGVAFLAGTYVFTDTLHRVFDGIVQESTQNFDVYVRSHTGFVNYGMQGDRQPVPATVLDTVEGVDGVASADGEVSGTAALLDSHGKLFQTGGAPMLGISWSPSPRSPMVLVDGRAPHGPTQVALDTGTASRLGFHVGDRIQIVVEGPVQSYRITGLARFGRSENLGGATMAMFDLRTAQELYHRVGEYDLIQVAASRGVSARELAARITPLLPPGVEAVTSSTTASEARKVFGYYLGFLSTALLIFALIALFVGAFLIFNTFTIIVAQQTREYGLLRSLGASPGQVTAAVLSEAAIVGVLASAVGLGAGLLIAQGLRSLMSAFGMNLPATGLVFTARTAIVSMALGIVVTGISAVLPARKAARIAPIAALRDTVAHARSIRARGIIGGIVFVAGTSILLVGLFGGVGTRIAWIGAGAALMFAGYGIASAIVARPLAAAIARPLPRLFGVSGKLARENSMRNPRRTATTSAALMIGVGLIVFVSVFSASIKTSASKGLDSALRADFVVTGAQGGGGMAYPFSSLVAGRMEMKPEFAAVSPVRTGEWRGDGDAPRTLAAVDPATIGEVMDLGVTQGSIAGLAQGGVMIKDLTASKDGLAVGDVLRMRFARTGVQHLPVVGFFDNGTALPVQSDYLVSLDTFEQNFSTPEQQDMSVYVKSAPAYAPKQIRAELDRIAADFPTVKVMDQAGVKRNNAEQVDRLMGMMSALLGLAVLIGLIGIANTLGLSIAERTRELGLLRAVGMTRHQMRSMVRWEAAVTSLVGAVLGVGIGLFFGWAVVSSMHDSGITEFAVPAVQLALFALIAGLAGVVAALPPARRAARMDVLRAIVTD